MRKKVVSSGHRREMAVYAVEAGLCSGREACRFLSLARSTYQYRSKSMSLEGQELLERVKEMVAVLNVLSINR